MGIERSSALAISPLHARGDAASKHPQLHAFGQQHPAHEQPQFTVLRIGFIQEPREIDVRRDGNAPPAHSKAAVAQGAALVAHRIVDVRAADEHNGTVVRQARHIRQACRPVLRFDARQRGMRCGIAIAFGIVLTDAHGRHSFRSPRARRSTARGCTPDRVRQARTGRAAPRPPDRSDPQRFPIRSPGSR